MDGKTIGLLVTRTIQLISAAVVLGLAVKLIPDFQDAEDFCKNYVNVPDSYCNPIGKFVTALEYDAFVGGFGLLDCLVGLVAAFLSAIPYLVPLALDALALIFFLAGGINNAVLRGKDIDDDNDDNKYVTQYDTTTGFLFIGFVASIASLALVFFTKRSGRASASHV